VERKDPKDHKDPKALKAPLDLQVVAAAVAVPKDPKDPKGHRDPKGPLVAMVHRVGHQVDPWFSMAETLVKWPK
jgi:hypothetical protein